MHGQFLADFSLCKLQLFVIVGNMSNMDSSEYIEIAEKVRSGEYFREVRRMIDHDLHDPMTDRYWYILITIPSVIIVFVSFFALQTLYPLKPSVPFIFGINDIMEDVPRIKSLIKEKGEGADAALRRFLVANYVKEREEYDASTFDRNQIALKTLSSKPVFSEYQDAIALNNPNSPIVLYQRHTARIVNVTSVQLLQKTVNKNSTIEDYVMRVWYEARLQPAQLQYTAEQQPVTRWQVDVAFKYEPIKLNEQTGEITPYGFLVTGYNAKKL